MCLHWKIAGKSKLNLMVIVVCLLLCGTLILPITSDTYSHIRNSNSNTVDTGLCICDCSLVRWCVFPYHRMDSSWLCTFLGNPVALFYVFSYHPFWEVFWTMVYDANGWNRLKTGFFGLKLALRRNIDLFI